MKRLKKVFQLSPQELWLLLQAAALLLTVHLALKFTTVARLQRIGATGESAAVAGGLSPQTISRLVRIAAEHGPYRAMCLEQSLVLHWLLQRQGIDARILFGTRKEDDRTEAHAWVEVDQMSFDEDDEMHRRFSPFEELAALKKN